MLITNVPNLQQKNGMLSMIKKNADYGEGNEDRTTIKFETKVIKSSICDY